MLSDGWDAYNDLEKKYKKALSLLRSIKKGYLRQDFDCKAEIHIKWSVWKKIQKFVNK